MAEATGLRNNALPYPVYGAPWGVAFPIFDADGDLVTGASSPDSEVSKNGDTFADCTNEATEIATNSGMYYLLLTATEMTADVVSVIVKSGTAGMKTTPIVLYPRKLVTIRSGTSAGGAAGYITLDASASAVDDFYNGMLCVGTLDATVEARIITDYTGSNKQAAVTPNWNTTPDADDTFIVYLPEGVQLNQANMTHILGTAVSTPATAGILDVNLKNIANAAVSTSTAQLGVNAVQAGGTAWGSGAITAGSIASNAIAAAKIASGAITSAKFAAGAIDAAAIAADAIGASELAADAVAEIAAAVWQDATAGDFTVASSIGKALYVSNVVPGAAGGHFIAGANAATSITTALTANITGNVTGNLTGSVGSVSGAVGSVSAGGIAAASFAAGAIDAAAIANGAIDNATFAADVGSTTYATNIIALAADKSIVHALATDTYAEPTGAPAATATLAAKLGRIYQVLRNGLTVTASAKTFTDDAGDPLWSKALSDDGTTYTEAEGS